MPEIKHGHGRHDGSQFAFILVLFILLAIIGCVCYTGCAKYPSYGFSGGCGCGCGY